MKDKIINFLYKATPWLSVLILWRLSVSFWNPAGILAIIPIFYCSFVRPVPWFAPFALLFCFLIDYKFGTLVFWTSLYCFFYALNGFQTFFDVTKIDKNAIHVFMIFLFVGLIILLIPNITFYGLLKTIWLFLWITALYIPITELLKRVTK
ncbi:MAG: hypothetical protein J6L70_03370 [Alphaproteobacteria bacterium]|nr:hypothetical protein [Alphaproteobacteria bacterium]